MDSSVVYSLHRRCYLLCVVGPPLPPICPGDFELISDPCDWSCVCPSSSLLRPARFNASHIDVSVDPDAQTPFDDRPILKVTIRSGVLTALSDESPNALLCIYEAVLPASLLWAQLAASPDLLVDPSHALSLPAGSACVHRWSDGLLVRSAMLFSSPSSGLHLSSDQRGIASIDIHPVYGALFPSNVGDARTYALGSDPFLPANSSTRLLPCQTEFVGPLTTGGCTQSGVEDGTAVRVTVVLSTGVQFAAGDSGATAVTSWLVLLAWILQAQPARFVSDDSGMRFDADGMRRFSWLILPDPMAPLCSPSPRLLAARLQSLMDFACAASAVLSSSTRVASATSVNPWMLSDLHRSWNCTWTLEVAARDNDHMHSANRGSVFSIVVALPLASWLLLCLGAAWVRIVVPHRIRWWLGLCSACTAAVYQAAVFGALSSLRLSSDAASSRAFSCLLSLWCLHAIGNLWSLAVNLRQQRHSMLLRTWLLQPASKIAVCCCCVLAIAVHPAALCLLHSRAMPCVGFDAPVMRTLHPFRSLPGFPRLSWSSWLVFAVHHWLPWATFVVASWIIAGPFAISAQRWALLLMIASVAHAILQAVCLWSQLCHIADSDLDSQNHLDRSEANSTLRQGKGTIDESAQEVELAALEDQKQQHAHAAAHSRSLSGITLDLQSPASHASPAASPVDPPALVVHFDESDAPMSPWVHSPPAAAASFDLHHRGDSRTGVDRGH